MALKPITTIGELNRLAQTNPEYAELAKSAARNLGGSTRTLDDAIVWLNTNADETSEKGVVEEINFLIEPNHG